MKKTYALSLLLAAALLVGCSGGSSEETSTGSVPPTSAQTVGGDKSGSGPTASQPDMSSYKPSSGAQPGSALNGR